MTTRKTKSRTSIKLSRCLARYPNGNRCRLSISDSSSFYCPRHAHLSPPGEAPLDLTDELSAQVGKFTSASSINRFLCNLLKLLSEDRITPRRGAVLAYTCNLLLRTLPAIEDERFPFGRKKPDIPVIWDMPGPDRSEPDDPPQCLPSTP